MATRAVSWTLTAELQLLHVLEYWTIRTDSAAYAEKLLIEIEAITQGISRFPLKCPTTQMPGVRMAAMGPYSLLYKVEPEHVRVVAFWDNRRDPEKLLQLLKASRLNK